MLKRPLDMRKDVPTVVDSIFQGQVSTTWIYKQCGHNSHKSEAFYELSLILQPKEHPTKSMLSLTLPAKEYPTKSVASPQRRGKLSRADHKNQLRQLGEKASQQRTVRLNKEVLTNHLRQLGEKASQQRAVRLNKAVLKNNLRQLGKALQQRNGRFFKKEEQKVDSIPSIKECLEYCFRKEFVIKCCEICSAENPRSN